MQVRQRKEQAKGNGRWWCQYILQRSQSGGDLFSGDWLVGDEMWGPPTQSTFKLNSIDLYLCFVNWLINHFDLNSSYGMIKVPREKNGTFSNEWCLFACDLCLWPITIKGRWSWWWSLSWRRHVGCWGIMSHLFQNMSTEFSFKIQTTPLEVTLLP